MYLISYDIEKDSLRTQIGNKIIEYGLTRIQYSVYLGYLKQTDYQELSKWLNQIIQKGNLQKDSIIILYLEKPQVKNMDVIGVQKLDIEELIDEKKTLIL